MAKQAKKPSARLSAKPSARRGARSKPAPVRGKTTRRAAAVLKSELTIANPDDFYEALIKAHEGLDDEKSRLVSARLIFLLANQIGDEKILFAAIAAAREGV